MDLEGRDRAVYVISVAAELTGVHPQTLRVYERRGLVIPARTGGMSRRYSEADIERIQSIQELTNQGLTLEGAKRILELEHEIERLQSQLDQLSKAVDASRRDLVPLRQEVVRYNRAPRAERPPG